MSAARAASCRFATQVFVVGVGQRHETVGAGVADQRIGAGEVDVVGDRDERRRAPFLVEAAGGVGEEQRLAAERRNVSIATRIALGSPRS